MRTDLNFPLCFLRVKSAHEHLVFLDRCKTRVSQDIKLEQRSRKEQR